MNTKPEISSLEELQLFHISILAFVMGPQLFPAEHVDTLICIIQTTLTVLSGSSMTILKTNVKLRGLFYFPKRFLDALASLRPMMESG